MGRGQVNPLLTAVAIEVLVPAARSLWDSLVTKAEPEVDDDEFDIEPTEPEGLREERNRADIAEHNAASWHEGFLAAREEAETLRLELEETRAELATAHATLNEVQAAFSMLQDALTGGMR